MLPAFRILNPKSIEDAVHELARLGDQVRVYGGGTELLILLRHHLIETDYLLNIKTIDSLSRIDWESDRIVIGAAVTHRRLEMNTTIRETLPMLARAESQVANIRVRGQGTIGGNLCFNDPHSDPATALLIYDAEARIHGPGGEKQIPLQEFLVGMYATALQSGELLGSIHVQPLPPGFGSSYLRIHRLQRPTLGVAAAARCLNGNIEEVRLAVGCIGPKAVRLAELESKIRGTTLNDSKKIIKETKSYLRRTLEPIDDLLGSAEYKLYLAIVLLERALDDAIADAERNHNGASTESNR
jgi:aerobic carbon-monoxide dehydrogenase medium subunit